jgi:hypothetical protein
MTIGEIHWVEASGIVNVARKPERSAAQAMLRDSGNTTGLSCGLLCFAATLSWKKLRKWVHDTSWPF